jgi:hypothetical protein
MHVAGISCDLAKALDYVRHELVLSTLSFLGTQSMAHTLKTESKKQKKVIRFQCSTCWSQDIIKQSLICTWPSDIWSINQWSAPNHNSQSMPPLFVDIRTITVLPQIDYFKNCVIGIFKKFNNWFIADGFILSFDKVIKFCTVLYLTYRNLWY